MGIAWTRRKLLQASLAAGLSARNVRAWARAAARNVGDEYLGPPQKFDFASLRERARQLAARPFRPAQIRDASVIEKITFDVSQHIRFRPEHALHWPKGAFPVELFHLDRDVPLPVDIHVVQDNQARRVLYAPSCFDYDATGLATRLPRDLGFSGFRAMTPPGLQGDWLAFQGASYFRSAGPLNQYGQSARGIAVDTTVPGRKEEFPRFVAFWLAEVPGEPRLTVYALLDGPSLAGAYRFDCSDRGVVVMDVHAELFQRAAIEQLGIAPLTSMYWYSETNQRLGPDWRPEIHDSDGLAMWTGRGERIWRPLNNPPVPRTNTFLDHDPKGFGLLQRDRNFDHYLDDGAYYDRRPSVWVEPKGSWGGGAITLLELPTDTEIEDNIVAFWHPDRHAGAGMQWVLDYRLHWVAEEPFPSPLARVVATRLGRPGRPGPLRAEEQRGRKLVVEFSGGPLAGMAQRFDLTLVATASRGTVANTHVLKILGTDRWRAELDLTVSGPEPVDLRCYLRLGATTLSETWLYQYLPGHYGFDCR